MSAAKTSSIDAIVDEDGICDRELAAEWEPAFERLAEPWMPRFPPGFLESVEGSTGWLLSERLCLPSTSSRLLAARR